MCLVGWRGRKINSRIQVFSPRTYQKVFSPKWSKNWREKLGIIFGQKCPCAIAHGLHPRSFSSHFFFSSSWVLPSSFFWVGLSSIFFFSFVFCFLFRYDFFMDVILFFNKFRWLIFFGSLSLFWFLIGHNFLINVYL